jgi:hypothetical protein
VGNGQPLHPLCELHSVLSIDQACAHLQRQVTSARYKRVIIDSAVSLAAAFHLLLKFIVKQVMSLAALNTSLKEMSINIRSLTFASGNVLLRWRKSSRKWARQRWLTSKTNLMCQLPTDVLRAIRYLNMQQKELNYQMDDNGQHGFQSMRPLHLWVQQL